MDQSITTKIILDSIADGVFTVDRDWNITSFNRAAERIAGIAAKKAVGQKCFDVFHANVCQAACVLKDTLKTGKEIIDRPVNILNHDGKVIPVSISTAVLKDERGNIIGGVETFRDLSALEALKKEISRQYSVEDIISKNFEIQSIFDILPDIAESESTVLNHGESGTGISDDVIRLFMTYDFPGNIRELENLLEHAFVMCRRGEITVEHLPGEFRETVTAPKDGDDNNISLQDRFKRSEAVIIKEALKRNRGLRRQTARELGIDPSTLWRKIKRLDIKEL